MTAIADANHVDAAYDGDALSMSLDAAFSDLFGVEVAAISVATGTAANAIALATLCPPYGAIICHRHAHIQSDECGAPEFYTNGSKLLLPERPADKLTQACVTSVTERIRPDVHRVQPHALSITNATENGLCYSPEEIAALGELARANRLGFHMDGARFANAVAYLGCTPAELTWKAGIDALSFGFVKNGGMSAEALVYFRRDLIEEARIRRKRAGHLLSKGRFQAAQILALLKGGLWLRHGERANAHAQRIGASCPQRLLYPVQANEIFIRLDKAEAAGLRAAGFGFHEWGAGAGRFVTSYDQTEGSVSALISAIAALNASSVPA